MIIEFMKPPAFNDFKTKFDTEKKKVTFKRTKEGITFTYNDKNILVPWHNIAAIEETDGK